MFNVQLWLPTAGNGFQKGNVFFTSLTDLKRNEFDYVKPGKMPVLCPVGGHRTIQNIDVRALKQICRPDVTVLRLCYSNIVGP